MTYFVYLARCADNSIYTGYCKDIVARERKHNQGDGAKYTRQRRPITVVYSEKYRTLSAALKRELALKKLTKLKKEDLIRSVKHSQ
ncbi:MAG: GIY-YIG nuclease family protein [Candidatus Komeilibacteria bacterium]|nr:GIY-YIG nuclease family protein [Candidatus Komeilibacteria bacterium]